MENSQIPKLDKESLSKALSTRKLALENCDEYYNNSNAASSKSKQKIIKYSSIIILLCLCVVCSLTYLRNFYKEYNNYDISESSINDAIALNKEGNYSEAIKKLLRIKDAGNDGIEVYRQLSYAYNSLKEYDNAADILCEYVTNYQKAVNSSPDGIQSSDIDYMLDGLSEDCKYRTQKLLSEMKAYEKLYDNAIYKLSISDYEGALRDCLLLKQKGADCYRFAIIYQAALIFNKNEAEAVDYTKEYINSFDSYRTCLNDEDSRYLMIRYACDNINDAALKNACNDLLNTSFDNKKIKSGLCYSKGKRLSVNSLTKTIKITLGDDLCWLNDYDEIYFDEKDSLFSGLVCKGVTITHYDADIKKEFRFYIDVYGDYLFGEKDGCYINLFRNLKWYTSNSGFDITRDIPNGIYRKCDNDSVKLTISDFMPNYISGGYHVGTCVQNIENQQLYLESDHAIYDKPFIAGTYNSVNYILFMDTKAALFVISGDDGTLEGIEGIYLNQN